MSMKSLCKLLAVLAALCTNNVMAGSEMDTLAGEWHGQIESKQGVVAFIFRFETAESGGITGFVNIAGAEGEGLRAGDIVLHEGVLSFKFNADKAEFQGQLNGDQIIGSLKTGGVTVPLNMEKGKYSNPYALNISREAMEKLNGEWHGVLKYPDGPMLVLFRFGQNRVGEYVGFADRPYNSDFNAPITDAVLDGEEIEFKVPGLLMTVDGRLDDDRISGTISARILPYPGGFPVMLEKGHYEIPDLSCNLPDDAVDRLLGTWSGYISPPRATRMKNIFHVTIRADGKVYCYYDNPTVGFYGSIMINKSWEDGRMVFETIFPDDAELKARLSGDRISGSWFRGSMRIPALYEKSE